MNGLKELINRHLDDFPEFSYYLVIIEKAEKNEIPQPDICIECCNSLIQGVSKTIILQLDPTIVRKDIEFDKTPKLVRNALRSIAANDDVYEDNFVFQGINLATSISALRNARGDISHGKAVPKILASDKALARVVLEMTATLLRYTLASFYVLELLSRAEEPVITDEAIAESSALRYGDNPEFNDFLDEQNPLEGKIMYSYALFELYFEDYEFQLSDYLYEQELEKS
jgi:hypothetical protein